MNDTNLLLGLLSPDRCYIRTTVRVEGLADLLASLGHYRWNSDIRCLTFPVSTAHIERLKARYGSRLVLDPSLSLLELCREIRIRQMSMHTLDAYFTYNRDLLRFANKYPHQINDEDLRNFIEHLTVEKKCAPATVNLAIDAIKFFLVEVRKMRIFLSPRPRKGVRLPLVLSAEEVLRIFDVTKNIKHKAMLMTAYSAGLRVSETASLQIPDIDFDRKLIRVRQGKGRKDRYTVLSAKAETVIRQYIEQYRPRNWLFEGQLNGKRLSIRTFQHVFEDACRKAGISKNVTFHGLRHSFATHLLENGIDIRYIKELLGHQSLRTTEIYTHVRRKAVESIRSPLDMI